MKRILTTLMIIPLGLGLLFGASPSSAQLSNEERAFYINNALSIQTREHTRTSVDAYTIPLGYYSDWTLYDTNTYTETNWYPYLGPQEISKIDFFRITGYDDIVASMEKDLETQRAMVIAGGTLMGAGLIGLIAGTIMLVSMEDNILPGTITATVSAVALGISVPLVMWQPDDNISISFAVNAADMYNRKLLEAIKTGNNTR